MDSIITKRLVLRQWQEQDIKLFMEMNQDPKVIEFLRGPLSFEDAKNFVEASERHFKKYGYGLWAATIKDTQEFIGFVGLNIPEFTADFTPCVEIGWRLASKYWGNGYAPEAAQEVLKIGFEHFKLNEIVSFTVPRNLRSIRVMEKIGLERDLKGDFMHPKLPEDHPLALHVLYRKSNPNIV